MYVFQEYPPSQSILQNIEDVCYLLIYYWVKITYQQALAKWGHGALPELQWREKLFGLNNPYISAVRSTIAWAFLKFIHKYFC